MGGLAGGWVVGLVDGRVSWWLGGWASGWVVGLVDGWLG